MAKKAILLFTVIFSLLASMPILAQKKDSPFKRGAGSFEYTGYGPLRDKPITLFYYIPTRGNIKKMKVLFSMHGAERSGLIQRGVWHNLAEEYGFIILAPQFTHANGYKENDYQFGGVSEDPKTFILKPRETWTYQIIEPLFDYFKECTGNTVKTYDMFGHSAGGQFVHRFLLMTPEARVGKAVAANPGNYTYPDENGLYSSSGKLADPPSWPYSVKNTPFATDEYLAPFFKRKLTILIGTNDTIADRKLAEDHPVFIQGINRFNRAWKFFNASQIIARKKNYEFNWTIINVPEASHSSAQMVYGRPSVRNWRIENDERVYNNKDLTNMGAYYILFEK